MTEHISVMKDEVLDVFSDMSLRVFFDGTLGAGGHAKALLDAHPEIGCYVGCDQDPYALRIATDTLSGYQDRLQLFHGNNTNLDSMLDSLGIDEVDGFFLI